MIPFKRKSASRVLGGVSSGDTEVGKNPFLSDKAGGHKKKFLLTIPERLQLSQLERQERTKLFKSFDSWEKNYEYILDFLEMVKFL